MATHGAAAAALPARVGRVGYEKLPFFGTAISNPDLRLHYTLMMLILDGFVIAAVNNYTSQHHINTLEAMRPYTSFVFCIVCTWGGVALFDARWWADSWFSRVCRFVHMLSFLSLSIAGTDFQLGSTNIKDVYAFYFIPAMMVNRVVLAAQSAEVTFAAW